MKTKELIKKTNELRLIGASIKDAYISFCETTTGIEFYRYPVWGIGRGDGYAELTNARDIYMVDLFKLMDLLDEYMKTPDLEREEEKRYWLRATLPIVGNKVKLYLNKHYTGNYMLSDFAADDCYKTIFNESEIAEMDITGFEKIEVPE